MRTVLLLTFSALLAGCIESYVPPIGGPQATLVAPADIPFAQRLVFIYADEHCHDVKSIRLLEGDSEHVPAGQPIFLGRKIDTTGLTVGVYCAAFTSFTPGAGKTYEVGWSWDVNQCDIPIRVLMPNGEKILEASQKRFVDEGCRDY